MARRLLAVIAAVAMVAAAFAIRSARDDGGGAGTEFVLICDEALADVCAQLDVDAVDLTVEPAAVTADRLVTADPDQAGLTAWLTAGPWPAMVNAAREASGRGALLRSQPVASTELGVVAETQSEPLTACLAEGPDWPCVADAAASGFRLSGPGDPSSIRLLARAAIVRGHFGADFARNDLMERPEVVAAMDAFDRRVEEGRRSGGWSLEVLLANPASADGFLTTAADANRLLAVAANAPRFALVVPGDPPVFVTATFGTLAGPQRSPIEQFFLPTFERLGWQRAVGDDGLPSPGVLHALREIFG